MILILHKDRPDNHYKMQELQNNLSKMANHSYDLLLNIGFVLAEIFQLIILIALCFNQVTMLCFHNGYFGILIMIGCLITMLFAFAKPILSHLNVFFAFLIGVSVLATFGALGFVAIFVAILYNGFYLYKDIYALIKYIQKTLQLKKE